MFGYKLRTLSESIGTFANLFRPLNGYLSSSPITKDLIFLSCISTYLVCNSFRIAILATIIDPDGWNLNLGIPRSLLLSIHTGEIVHLQAIYPVLNGLGLLAMIVTGLSMTSLFSQKPKRE